MNANTSAVSILLPAISEDTSASLATLQWAVTGYSLVGAAVIVTSGALGDIFGRRRIFIGGLLLFVASCVLIALGDSAGTVIGGRAIQGAAGSTILVCGLSLLSAGASGEAQMRSVSLWGAASAAGAAAGPLLGGVLVDVTGWQGLFWIDAGIAAVCVPLTLRTVPESRDPLRPRSVDLAGTALVAAVLVPFVFAVTEGADWGWLSVPTLACFMISAVAVAGFVMVEKRVRTPLIDLAFAAQQDPGRFECRHSGGGGMHQRGDVCVQSVLPEPRWSGHDTAGSGSGHVARGGRDRGDRSFDHAVRR
nr:MFS transporter [Streptomyces sp. DSM 40907]